jgi:hypothetical protein
LAFGRPVGETTAADYRHVTDVFSNRDYGI